MVTQRKHFCSRERQNEKRAYQQIVQGTDGCIKIILIIYLSILSSFVRTHSMATEALLVSLFQTCSNPDELNIYRTFADWSIRFYFIAVMYDMQP